MSENPIMITTDQGKPGAVPISVQIEPSLHILTAMVRLFQSLNQPQSAADLCRLGLMYYPNNLEIRQLMTLAYLDLGKFEMAWPEIESAMLEIGLMVPWWKEIGERAKAIGENDLSEWANFLYQLLSKFPNKNISGLKKIPSNSITYSPKESLQENESTQYRPIDSKVDYSYSKTY